ncbi:MULTISPECIES: VOC family protein [Bacillus]|uniref:PhnB protein n=1 Tax=Bacillus wiedmannii TaxID=1890302 RepID=A0A2A7XY67_9BACI|nr:MULTISPECIES: VOC family protein [Bacillus cereus group]EOP12263.1 PhnB protein [Bacillus cereus BAG2O-3]EOQ10338.1 PhnB protein [Bacillus cereus B5-2]EOQ29281.1 PhnB protein [Bacillus cereus BAG3O-1]MBJ8116464.1 VOC family protein [Bacillus cereus]PFW87440.1 VOC family protein [Bacillus sp. AFS075960]RFB15937.1 VOC family protein [Bacillus sp. OE]RFB23318.1 VOC family protein [Bacillus sp. LB(2018)]RFB44204.1 VOC family protein [Bacillus sp. dmp10]HDR8169390.1 VOC family protein [Bacil
MTLEIAIFLSMNGQAKEAINFYTRNLEAKKLMVVTYEELAKRDRSFKITSENKDYIAHSVLQIGNTKLMIAEDTMKPNERYNVGNNMSLCIQSANLEEIQRFYNNLISNKHVKIISPLEKNIFSEAYGIIEDPYGIQIQLMYDKRLN